MERLLRCNYSIISGPIGRDARGEDLMLVKGRCNQNGKAAAQCAANILLYPAPRPWMESMKSNREHIGCLELSIPTLVHIALNCNDLVIRAMSTSGKYR